MQLENLDFLSPSITLFHYGRRNHSSRLGGILSIIGFMLCLAYIIYIAIGLLKHTNLSLYYYKKFEWEAGKYYLDNQGIYHFIQFSAKGSNSLFFSKYDKKYIRIFTTKIVERYASNPGLLDTNDHWVYDLCEKGIDDKGLDSSLFEKIYNFTNSACIKYYYNANDKKYYNKNDKEFIYPSIEHGNSRIDNTMLGTIIEKCRNDSKTREVLGDCGGEEGIDQYIKDNFAIYFQFIDHQVDPTNTQHPIQSFITSFSSRLSNNDYPVHNINFSPLVVKTDKGFIKENFVEDKSFIFDVNRKDSKSNNGITEITTQISYWIQNNFIIYERRYKKLLDIIPTIGGIAEVIYYVLFTVNFLYHNYILLLNTKSLFIKIQSGCEIHLDEKFRNEQEKFIEIYKNMEMKEEIESKKRRYTEYKKNNKYYLKNFSSKQLECHFQSFKGIKTEKFNQNPKLNNYVKQEKNFIKNKTKNDSNLNLEEDLVDNSNKKEKSSTETYFNNFKKGDDSYLCTLGNINNGLIQKNKTRNEICNVEKNNINNNHLLNEYSFSPINNNRYNNFKEELHYFMNENKKKVNCANKKMIYIENHFSFFDYFSALFFNKTKQNGLYILEHFRRKLLSEEHFYRSHLNLYLLVKYFDMEQEKADIFELFKNL